MAHPFARSERDRALYITADIFENRTHISFFFFRLKISALMLTVCFGFKRQRWLYLMKRLYDRFSFSFDKLFRHGIFVVAAMAAIESDEKRERLSEFSTGSSIDLSERSYRATSSLFRNFYNLRHVERLRISIFWKPECSLFPNALSSYRVRNFSSLLDPIFRYNYFYKRYLWTITPFQECSAPRTYLYLEKAILFFKFLE